MRAVACGQWHVGCGCARSLLVRSSSPVWRTEPRVDGDGVRELAALCGVRGGGGDRAQQRALTAPVGTEQRPAVPRYTRLRVPGAYYAWDP